MVRASGFKFELVDAETKLPFKEHSHGEAKFFVEAEPGAEYFLSIQKMEKTETDVCLFYTVDGTATNCQLRYGKKAVDKTPLYKGIRTEENGTSTHTALEFVKPKFSATSGSNSNLGMGNVQMKVYELHYTGRMKERKYKHSSINFEAATVAVDSAVASKKKNLRSGVGTATITKRKEKMEPESRKGKHLDTSTFSK